MEGDHRQSRYQERCWPIARVRAGLPLLLCTCGIGEQNTARNIIGKEERDVVCRETDREQGWRDTEEELLEEGGVRQEMHEKHTHTQKKGVRKETWREGKINSE